MDSDSREPATRAIDHGSADLLQRSKLVRERGLELQRELQLRTGRAHELVATCQRLAKSLSAVLRTRVLGSVNLAPPENIGPEMNASNLLARNVFDGRPELSGDKGPLEKPLGNRLLAKRRAVHELRNPVRKRRLATREIDGPLKSSNVRFLHNHPAYTTNVVRVNNSSRVPFPSVTCTVLSMPAVQRNKKPQLDAGARLDPTRGPDGLTLGERIKACMEAKGRRLGKPYLQKNLLADANLAAGRTPDNPIITQQGLSLIIKNKRFESGATAAFAAALDVEALWLGFGTGPKSYLDAALKKTS